MVPSLAAPPAYAELATMTNFSFLRGASHPEELVAHAARLGLAGIGIADRNSMAGVVRAHVAARELKTAQAGLRLAIGCRLVFCDATPDIIAYPEDRAAYGRLTRLLTLGNSRARKGDCLLTFDDLAGHATGLRFILLPVRTKKAGEPEITLTAQEAMPYLAALRDVAPARIWLGLRATYGPHGKWRMAQAQAAARKLRLPVLAVGDVLYHVPERRPLQDVLTCIREGRTLDTAGALLEANGERHIKRCAEMARIFHAAPEAIHETTRFLNGLTFSLDMLKYEYPEESHAGFASPQEALRAFAFKGAQNRYPDGVPEKVHKALDYELDLIAQLQYAPYFLTVYEIVCFARSQDILCQGRGSAANSTLCFCLGITEVDPARNDMLFERFISLERREPPDIDVDFEHERRETVMQYIYDRYGRERAGLAASVITYRSRSAIREVGKACGLSNDTVTALSGTIWGWSSGGLEEAEVRRLGLDPTDARVAGALLLTRELIGFPRHLSQHTGGFVITRSRLDEVVPIGNAAMDDRTFVEWDKDDLDALGILKIDILALGMLSCLRRAFGLLEQHYGNASTLASLPAEDGDVYRMIQRADTIGVFQIESRAQMSMLPRLKPANFYDLVIEVAIVRPGPIQGDMVHPYLRRREGKERVHYPSPAPDQGPANELEQVLGKTLGVPLFQEQAMRIAIVAAGFTPSEADRLRRAMATFRRVGTIGTFQRKMVEGMTRRGYDEEFAARCFKQIEGFGEYGFPESHAASFALLVYASCWFKCRYPDVFAAALLNAQPLGFYAPAQIIRDARDHGVECREIDINHSHWDATLEAGQAAGLHVHPRHVSMRRDIWSTHALRLGFREIKGLGQPDADRIVQNRGAGYDSVRDLWLRAGLTPATLTLLAEADAFRSLGLDRREALWAVRGLQRSGDKENLPLFLSMGTQETEPDAALPPMPLGQHVVEDYRHLSLSLKAHPVSFVRHDLNQRRVIQAGALALLPAGRVVTVAGLVLVRQRPGSAKGVIFLTLEDESGTANVIIWPSVFELFRPLVLGSRFCAITGRLQNEKGVVHLVAASLSDFTPLLGQLTQTTPDQEKGLIGRAALAPADHGAKPLPSPASVVKRSTRNRLAELLGEEPGLAADLTRLARADEVARPQKDHRDKRVPRNLLPEEAEAARRILPRGRNFH